MAETFGDKTYEATPYRRQKAREQGQVARSQDLASAAVLVLGLVIVLWLGRGVADFIAEYMRRQLSGDAWLTANRDFVVHEWVFALGGLTRFVLPALLLIVLITVLAQFAQFGLLWLPEKLAIDPERINPVAGFQRIFSLQNVVRLGFGIFKIALVAGIAVWCVWGQIATILAATGLDVPQVAAFVTDTTLWTGLKIGGALLALALLDFLFQWWKNEQDLRMTHQEVRDEMKQLQGDPQIAQRRKVVQRQLVLNRLKSVVPSADAVVTNPTELAIAIKYDIDQMAAPIVVAKGAGVVAQRIRRLALENSIPIVERKDLARALYKQVEIGQPVPTEQYAAVAEVLRYVYELKGKTASVLQSAQLGTRNADPAGARRPKQAS